MGVALRVADVVAAGAMLLSSQMAGLAIAEVDAPPHVKDTLRAIAARVNDDTLEAFPSLDRIAKDCGVQRRAAFDRVKAVRALTIEKHQIQVIADPRWETGMRLPGDRRRAYHYRIYSTGSLAQQLKAPPPSEVPPQDGARNDAVDESGADQDAAPANPPPSAPRLEALHNEPGSLDTGSAGAASGGTPAPPQEALPLAPGPELEASAAPQERPAPQLSMTAQQVRDALLAHPQTADMAGEAERLQGIGRKYKKKLGHVLFTIDEVADQSVVTEPYQARWERMVRYLRKQKEQKLDDVRLAAAAQPTREPTDARAALRKAAPTVFKAPSAGASTKAATLDQDSEDKPP